MYVFVLKASTIFFNKILLQICMRIHFCRYKKKITYTILIKIVQPLGKSLKVEITGNIIDACHRLWKRHEDIRSVSIIVKLVRQFDRFSVVEEERGGM